MPNGTFLDKSKLLQTNWVKVTGAEWNRQEM